MEFFSENLRRLRENDGLKLAEMQAVCGFPRSTWNGYEKGTSFPNFKDFLRIADFFGVLESDLLHTNLEKEGIEAAYLRFAVTRPAVTPSSKSYISWYSANEKQIAGSAGGVLLPEKLPDSLPNSAEKWYKEATFETNIVSEDSAIYQAKMPKVITMNEHGVDNILYVPVKARAGYLLGHGDKEFIETLPTFRMPGLNNRTYRMFEVEGLSMAGTLSDRDRVIGEWVPSIDQIRENRVHVIVTADGVLIKRVLNRVKERGCIYLKSDTITHRQDYPLMELDPKDIVEIWYVNMKVSSDLSEPAEIYQRVSDLEIFKHEVMKRLNMKEGS